MITPDTKLAVMNILSLYEGIVKKLVDAGVFTDTELLAMSFSVEEAKTAKLELEAHGWKASL